MVRPNTTKHKTTLHSSGQGAFQAVVQRQAWASYLSHRPVEQLAALSERHHLAQRQVHIRHEPCLNHSRLRRRLRKTGWSVTSRAELIKQGNAHIFSHHEYPLQYQHDLTRLLRFKLDDGKSLLIPCTEYFIRAYARNMEVCRALATLRWSDVKSVLFDDTRRDAHRWLVKPSAKMRGYDAVFLAHLLYDDYADEQIRRVNAQFISRDPSAQIFMEATPWFTGKGQLECRGRWLNDGNTFLCLNLSRSSQPDGEEIEWQTKSLIAAKVKKEDGWCYRGLSEPLKPMSSSMKIPTLSRTAIRKSLSSNRHPLESLGRNVPLRKRRTSLELTVVGSGPTHQKLAVILPEMEAEQARMLGSSSMRPRPNWRRKVSFMTSGTLSVRSWRTTQIGSPR